VKRVPPFVDEAEARRYIATCDRFFATLDAAGVACWPTSLHCVARDDGRFVVYHHQPIAGSAQIGNNVLRAAPPADSHPLLDAIAQAAVATVSHRVGFDVQVANWVWDGSIARQIDFTSPFTLNEQRNDLEFDTSSFLREYPAVLRPVLKRELLKVIVRYTTPEGALGDMIANLQKERLHQWVDPALDAAKRVGVVIDRAATTKMYEDDKKLMPLTLKLKKGQRWWVQHTGRRYDSLLPDGTTYDD
jgi:hypothetical protein